MSVYWNPITVPGSTVRKIRDALSMSQADFAAQLGLSRRTIIRWERDKARFDRYPLRYNNHPSPYPKFCELAKRARVKLPKVDV